MISTLPFSVFQSWPLASASGAIDFLTFIKCKTVKPNSDEYTTCPEYKTALFRKYSNTQTGGRFLVLGNGLPAVGHRNQDEYDGRNEHQCGKEKIIARPG